MMSSTATLPALHLSKASLSRLLDALLYPNPEDPDDPWGPLGPISRFDARNLSWAALNPQPLPPVAGPSPDPWRIRAMAGTSFQPAAGPGPQPWRSALLARTVIDYAVANHRWAEASRNGEQAETAFGAARHAISELVDYYCGTGRPRLPLPWPWPLTTELEPLDPVDMLVAGSQFHKAAAVIQDSPLQSEFAAAADRLFEAGSIRLQESEQHC